MRRIERTGANAPRDNRLGRLIIVVAIASGACKGDDSAVSTSTPSTASSATDERAARAEPPAVFSELRLREEQYHLENGAYLSTGTELSMWPAAPGETVSGESLPATWKQLRTKLHSDKLHCSYVAVAGAKGDGSTAGAIAKAFDFAPPATNWFYLIARCPTINTVFFARSGADRVESKPLSSL